MSELSLRARSRARHGLLERVGSDVLVWESVEIVCARVCECMFVVEPIATCFDRFLCISSRVARVYGGISNSLRVFL